MISKQSSPLRGDPKKKHPVVGVCRGFDDKPFHHKSDGKTKRGLRLAGQPETENQESPAESKVVGQRAPGNRCSSSTGIQTGRSAIDFRAESEVGIPHAVKNGAKFRPTCREKRTIH